MVSVLFFNIAPARALSAVTSVSGYAWSETIGWIDMTPAYGGVYLDDVNGVLGGYAWSENIGWVKFGGLSSFPGGVGGNALIDFSTGKVTGWIRACAGTASGNCSSMTSRTDGWDGWIRLDGHSNSVSFNTETGSFSGFAWGSSVVGWVDFSGVSVGGLFRTLSISSNNPASGVTMVVSPADVAGNANGSTPFQRTYNVYHNSDVSVTAPATVGGQTFSAWHGCNSVTGRTCNVKVNSNKTVIANYATPVAATVNISASPTEIKKGNSANITFSYQNATNCTVTGYGSSLNYPNDSRTFSVSPVVNTTYEINCSPAGTNSYANVLIKILNQEFDITVIKSGQGVVVSSPDGIKCGEGCSSQSAKFEEGEEITLTATPSTGRIFVGWSDSTVCDGGSTKEADGSGGTCTLTATGNKTVHANFAINPNYKEF